MHLSHFETEFRIPGAKQWHTVWKIVTHEALLMIEELGLELGTLVLTFFGHEGAKNGAIHAAIIIFIGILGPYPLAFAKNVGNTWVEQMPATWPTTSTNTVYNFNAGANTPPTVEQPTLPQGQHVLLSPGQVSYNIISKPYFRVRQDLTLEMTQWYTFNIVPSTENIGPYVYLKQGDFYKIRFVVVLPKEEYLHQAIHDPTPEQRYVTSAKILGRYVNGSIRVTVPLTFPDIQVTWIRSNLYLEITPIDQSTIRPKADNPNEPDVFNTQVVTEVTDHMQPIGLPFFFTPQKPADGKLGSSALVNLPDSEPEITADLDAYVTRAQTVKPLPSEGNSQNVDPATYAEKAGLKMLDMNSPELDQTLLYLKGKLPPAIMSGLSRPQIIGTALDRQKLAKFLQINNSYVQPMPDQMDPTLARAFCSELAQLQQMAQSHALTWINRCTSYPYYYLTFFKNIHVKSLNTLKTSGTPEIKRPYQVISNLALNKSHSTDLSANLSFAPFAIFPLNGFNEVLKGVGVSVASGVSEGVSVSISQSGNAQSFMAIYMEPIITKLPINRYTTCLAIEIDPTHFPLPIKIQRGLYICDNEQQNLLFSERYYFTWQDTLAQEEASAQAAHFLFRGDRDANTFMRLVDNYVQPLRESPMVIGDVFSYAGYTYEHTAPPVPGVITLPMAQAQNIQSQQHPGVLKKPHWYQQVYSLVTGNL